MVDKTASLNVRSAKRKVVRPKGKPLSSQEQERLAHVVAALYWGKARITQADIARRLRLSAVQVGRLLRLAEDLGFVSRPVVHAANNRELEASLLRAFPSLRRASVVLADARLPLQDRINAVALCAAEFWADYLRPRDGERLRVALGGGRAIARLVDSVPDPGPEAALELLALSNIPSGDAEVSANTNLAVVKRRFPDRDIVIRPLLAMQLSPEMSESDIRRERKRILSLRIVQQHLNDAAACRLVFVGIGSFDDPNLWERIKELGVKRSGLSPKAIGDLIYNLVHDDDQVFHKDSPLDTRVITVPVATLVDTARREDSLVVAIAWGREKARPALAAQRAGAYNVLICDEGMAEEMLGLVREHPSREGPLHG